MPYKINNSANLNSWATKTPLLDSVKNSNFADSIQRKYNQPLSRYAIGGNGFDKSNNFNFQSQPTVATTFKEGFNAWGKNYLNNMKYIGSSLQKEASGDNYIKEAINSLQKSYNGNLLGQSNDALRSKIAEIDYDSYNVPFPSMNPTHALSLKPQRKVGNAVMKNILNDIIAKRDSGYNEHQIEEWLADKYNNGTSSSAQHRRVLQEAENVPQTKGWGTVGKVAGELLAPIASVVGAAVNPTLGVAMTGAMLGNNMLQTIANANKEIDLYEKNANVSVPKSSRETYVAGAAATDLIIDGLMQSQYLKHLNLPMVGSLRKSLFKKLLNNTQAMHEFNDLFRHSAKLAMPGIMKNAGKLSLEQAGASALSSTTQNMLGYVYKNPEHYPQLNDILGNIAAEAAIGAASGLITGGVASGLGTFIKPNRSKRSFASYDINLPDEKPVVDLEGLSIRDWLDREAKKKSILKENHQPAPFEETLPYDLNLPDETPLVDLDGLSLKGYMDRERKIKQIIRDNYNGNEDYNEVVSQLRRELRDYYLPKPRKESAPSLYELNLPDETPLVDLEGLSLREWLDREARIKSILKENYQPAPLKGTLPYNLNLPDETPLVDLDGLSLRGYMDRERKIKQVMRDNYNGNEDYNEVVSQLRKELRDYYLPKPRKESAPSLYELNLPDETPLVDLEGLSIRDWLDREARIKSILKENYQPRRIDMQSVEPVAPGDGDYRGSLMEDGSSLTDYSNSLKRMVTDDLAKTMNINTRVFNDISSLPVEYKKFLDDHSRSKGFYNPETDEVVVIANNIENQADLQNHLIQKGYGSKGLESVLGKELDNLLDDVYNNMSNRESAKYSNSGNSSRDAALSYISDLAKNPEVNPGEWNRLSNYMRELFKTKYNVQNLSDETIKQLLWRTGNQITGDDSIEEMIRKSAGLAILRDRDNSYLKNLNPGGGFKNTRIQNIYKNIMKKPIDLGFSDNNAYLYKNIDYGNYKLLDAFDVEDDYDFIKELNKAINNGEIKTHVDYLNFLSNLYNR